MEDDLKIFKEIKNSKSGISQQPLIGSYLNFNCKVLRPNHVF